MAVRQEQLRRECFERGPRPYSYLLLRTVVARHVLDSLIDLVSVGRILKRHDGILCDVLAFEETREERQALLGSFGSA
jgi:hypothetical protein